jgi:hypothetical protein
MRTRIYATFTSPSRLLYPANSLPQPFNLSPSISAPQSQPLNQPPQIQLLQSPYHFLPLDHQRRHCCRNKNSAHPPPRLSRPNLLPRLLIPIHKIRLLDKNTTPPVQELPVRILLNRSVITRVVTDTKRTHHHIIHARLRVDGPIRAPRRPDQLLRRGLRPLRVGVRSARADFDCRGRGRREGREEGTRAVGGQGLNEGREQAQGEVYLALDCVNHR